MGRALRSGGGGGISSDELTATADKVLSGYTYVGQDSDDDINIGSIPSQAAKTVIPSTSAQTALSAGYYTTGAITVAAIPNQKSDSGNVTLNSTTTTKSYAAGYYANAHGATVSIYNGSVTE